MSAHLKWQKLNRSRMRMKSIMNSYAYGPRKPPILQRPSRDTSSSSLLTYIRQQKTTRGKLVKVTLPKLKEP